MGRVRFLACFSLQCSSCLIENTKKHTSRSLLDMQSQHGHDMTLIRYAADQDARRSGFVKDLYLESVPKAVAFHEWLGIKPSRPSREQSASGPQVRLIYAISVAQRYISGEHGYHISRQMTLTERQELVQRLRCKLPFLWGSDENVSTFESCSDHWLNLDHRSNGKMLVTWVS